jgi:hypothetical protein
MLVHNWRSTMFGSLFAAAQPALKITRLQLAEGMPPMTPGAPEAGIATLSAEPTGAMAFLMKLFNAGKTSTVTITNQRISRIDQSSSTRDTVTMPLSRASTFHYGFKKVTFAIVIVGGLLVLLGLIAAISGGIQAAMVPLIAGGSLIATYFFTPGSYYMWFSSVSGVSIIMKVKTKDPAELDRMCDMAFEAVRIAEQGGVQVAYRAA